MKTTDNQNITENTNSLKEKINNLEKEVKRLNSDNEKLLGIIKFLSSPFKQLYKELERHDLGLIK